MFLINIGLCKELNIHWVYQLAFGHMSLWVLVDQVSFYNEYKLQVYRKVVYNCINLLW